MFAIAVSAMFTAAVNAAAPVISLSTSQPTIPGTSVASLAIGKSSPYAVSTVISDPTDPLQTSGVYVNITNSPTSFSFTSDNSSVVAVANCKCELVSGTTYKVTIVPSGVGYATVGLTASNGSNSSEFQFKVAASAASARPDSTVFPTTIADASAAAPVGTDYMLIADDEANLLRLFYRNRSGQAIKTFDVTNGAGGKSGEEFDIEGASASVKYNAGNRLYWITSLGNSKKGNLKPYRNRLFATDVTGTGADLTVTVKSYSTKMRDALIAWGDACGWNFTASAADGVVPKNINGFNVEGLAVAYGGEVAYVGFRAPYVPLKNVAPTSSNRKYAVAAPVTNLETMLNVDGESSIVPTFGEPVLFDFGELGIRSMERIGTAGFVIVAGSYASSGTPGLYLWNGNVPANSGSNPLTTASKDLVKMDADLSGLVGGTEGHPEALLAEQDGKTLYVHLICDNGSVDYYGDEKEAKTLDVPFMKFRMDTYVYNIPDEYVFPTATLEAVEKISIAVAGREISAGEGNSVSVYDMNGRLVVDGVDKVIVPESGVYAVSVNNGRAQKIMIK